MKILAVVTVKLFLESAIVIVDFKTIDDTTIFYVCTQSYKVLIFTVNFCEVWYVINSIGSNICVCSVYPWDDAFKKVPEGLKETNSSLA